MEPKSFANLIDELLQGKLTKLVNKGTVTTAQVVTIKDTQVVVDIGFQDEREVPIAQFKKAEGQLEVKVGDEIPVFIATSTQDLSIQTVSYLKPQVVTDVTKLHVGQVILGIAKRFIKKNNKRYVVVDLGQIEGNLSQKNLSWTKGTKLSDVIKPSDKLLVQVIAVNPSTNHVALGLKQVHPNDAWIKAARYYQIGDQYNGTVTGISSVGCHVELASNFIGFVNASNLDWNNSHPDPATIVSVGQLVKVQILDIDISRYRLSLGIKQCQPNPWIDLKHDTWVAGQITASSAQGLTVTLTSGLERLVPFDQLEWSSDPQEAHAQEGIAHILEVDPATSFIKLGLAIDAVTTYLHQLQDKTELNNVLEHLAQSLGLSAQDDAQAPTDASHDPSLELRRFLDVLTAIGSDQVTSIFDQGWMNQVLQHATTTDLLRSCFRLVPASNSAQNLQRYESVLTEFEYCAATELEAFRPKLQALLEQLLSSNDMLGQPHDLVRKLLAINLQLEPKLYPNLITHGTSSGVSSIVARDLDLVCSNLIALADAHSLENDTQTVVEQMQLPHLLFSMIMVRSQDPKVLAWLPTLLGLGDQQIRIKLEGLFEYLFQSDTGTTPRLLKLDTNNQVSLEILALLPRKARLAHSSLLLTSPLWPEFLAREFNSIIAPLTQVLTWDMINQSLELLGLRLYQAPANNRRSTASKNLSKINWSSELDDNLATAALALSWALSDDSVSAKLPYLSTALLLQAPEMLASVVAQLKDPDFAQLKELLTPTLYQNNATAQRPWFNSLAQSLVHKLGCSASQLTSTLDHYMVVGPDDLRSDFAQIVPLKPLSTFKPDANQQLLGTAQYQALVLTSLNQVVTQRLNSGYQISLAPADFESSAQTPWHERRYLVYGTLSCIKDKAPALYELLDSNLKSAPKVLALNALPAVITTQLQAINSPESSLQILEASDLKAFMCMVMTTSELIAANYPVTYWGSLDELSSIDPANLSVFSLLLVGQNPKVLMESLAPQPLALNVNSKFYQAHASNLALTLTTNYHDQLNIIEGKTAHDLLQLHGNFQALAVTESTAASSDEAEDAPHTPACVILTRKLDDSFNLYTLELKVQAQLAAFETYRFLDLSAQLWPSILQATLNERPVTISYISTHKDSKRSLPLILWQHDDKADQARNAEQKSLILRNNYNPRHRELYFTQQLHLLQQLSQGLTQDQALCYLIEYEGDVAPVCAYLKALDPQLARRITVLSLSTLLPQSLCSDLTSAQLGATDAQALPNLAQGTAIVINSLEQGPHKLLIDLVSSSYRRLTVQHTLLELGLSSIAINLDADSWQKLKTNLQNEELIFQEQSLNLTLLQGLLTLLYFRFGTVSRTCDYYLLEPKLNNGLEFEVATPFANSFSLEPLPLKPFASIHAKDKAIEQAQPFFVRNQSGLAEFERYLECEPDDPIKHVVPEVEPTDFDLLIPSEHERAPQLDDDIAPKLPEEVWAPEAENTIPETQVIATEPRELSLPEPQSEQLRQRQEQLEPQLGLLDQQPEPSPELLPEARGIYAVPAQSGKEVLERLEQNGPEGTRELQKALIAISKMFIGGNAWRPYQLSALPVILQHKNDVLISLPTGGGKSVLFQGPAWYRSLLSGCLTLVITPLKALMVDQILALKAKNYLSVDYLSSDLPYHESLQAMQRLRDGTTTLLYITPERFRSRYFVQSLKMRYEQDKKQGEYIVFDEAHCISQWGKEFRPDYIYAAQLVATLREIYNFKVLMCSATMTNQVITDLTQFLDTDYKLLGEVGKDYNPIRPHIGLTTQELRLDAAQKREDDVNVRVAAIIDFIRREHVDFSKSRMLVFCQSRKNTEELCLVLDKYATHLRHMYDYQQQHPGQELKVLPLVRVIEVISATKNQVAPEEPDHEADEAILAEQDDTRLTPALFAATSAIDQELSIALSDTSSSVQSANDQLCCDVAVIDPNDPVLQLSLHLGFFHAGMSARARESVFTRYKESSQQAIIEIFKSKNELWFVDNAIMNEEPETSAEQSQIDSTQPLYLLFATKAFGMGMDIPNIHYVLHAAPSAVFEDYLQEVGRAGRSQEMYEAAFPAAEDGTRKLLPTTCFYSTNDFDRVKDLTQKSLIGWSVLMSFDEQIRQYIELYVDNFSSLEDTLTKPVIVPEDLANLQLILKYESEVLYSEEDTDQNNKSALIYYYLQHFGRIKLSFRGPCPLKLTLNRAAFMKMWQNANLSLIKPQPWLKFVYNQQLKAGPCARAFAPKDIVAQNMVMLTLKQMLDAFDARLESKAHEKDHEQAKAPTEPTNSIRFTFDLQNFLYPVDDYLGERPHVSQTETINAFIEFMAAGILKLQLPFALNFGKKQAKKAELEYYLERHTQIPAISAPVLPLLTITLRVCQLILEQSYQDFCAEVKRRQERGTLKRFDEDVFNNIPLPNYKGSAFSNQWIDNQIREMVAPFVDEFSNMTPMEQAVNPLVPWLESKDPHKNTWQYYVDTILTPSVRYGVSYLLQQLPYIKCTKGQQKQPGQKKPVKVLMVKTWSQSFYLMLDLLYEDSWNLLSLIYQRNQAQVLDPNKPLVNTTNVSDAAKSTVAAASQLSHEAQLKDWGDIIFMLGLRHESSTMVLDNYELNCSRRNATQWYQELNTSLATFQYLNNLLGFVKTLGLMRSSELLFSGFELYLTPESAELPMDEGNTPDSKFNERRKQFEEINQFKQLRLAAMETYCKYVPDDKRRKFIEEFFQSNDNDDYIKHIGNYSDAGSSILQEITASRLTEEEEKLRANPEQWAVYNAPLAHSLNVMAGPGSGKTHVLALRCVRMIFRERVPPESILVLAYNRAVVVELKTRLDQIFTNLGLRKMGRRVAIFTFHSLAKICLGAELKDISTEDWEYAFVSKLKAQPQLFKNRFANLRYIMIDEFQDITHARLELLNLLKTQYDPLILFTIGDINQSIYGFSRIENILRDPIQSAILQNGTMSAQEYATGLGPDPYYRNLNNLFEPDTMSLKLNYRSFPNILERAKPLALDPNYTSQSAPLLVQYAPQHRYCNVFVCTSEALRQTNDAQERRDWTRSLPRILVAVQKQNAQAKEREDAALSQLKLQDPDAIAHYKQLLFTSVPASKNQVEPAQGEPTQGEVSASKAISKATIESPLALEKTSNQSANDLLLKSHYQRIKSLALFFRTNNEVYRALEQVRALPPEILADIEIHLQGSSSNELWREREFYALAHFILKLGNIDLHLSNTLMQQSKTEHPDETLAPTELPPLSDPSCYNMLLSVAQEDARSALKLLTLKLMDFFPAWDRSKLDMAYCMALSFSSTMSSNYSYTWADLYEYYIDLLSRDDGGQCYKIYDSMWRLHLEQKRKSLSLTFTTMHKVKGLEYDMVLIPPCQINLPLKPHKYVRSEPGQLRFDPKQYANFEQAQRAAQQIPLSEDELADIAEERRLYYVAYTRARKYLYVYYGDREQALNQSKRYLAPEEHSVLSEKDDSLENYVLSFNAWPMQRGADIYIEDHVKLHDQVVIRKVGYYYKIMHRSNGNEYCIGHLSSKSNIRAQMQNQGVIVAEGLFISNIIVWTYQDTIKSDILHVQEAMEKQRNGYQTNQYDLTQDSVRTKIAQELNVKLYAKDWSPEAINKGYCYLIVLAGRGRPSQSGPEQQRSLPPATRQTWPQQQVAPRPITRPVHANNWNRYRDNGRPNTARTPEDLLKDYSIY